MLHRERTRMDDSEFISEFQYESDLRANASPRIWFRRLCSSTRLFFLPLREIAQKHQVDLRDLEFLASNCERAKEANIYVNFDINLI